MKKILVIASAFLITVLAFHVLSRPTTAAAAPAPGIHAEETAAEQSTPPATVQAAAPAPGQTPEERKALADLDSSAAQISKFVSDPAADATGASSSDTQLSARFGSRSPRKCPAITSPPTAAQAATLVQCTMDYETPQQAKLHQDIAVKLESPRGPRNSDRWPNLDSRFPVVDFGANATVYLCGPILEAVMHNTGKNCDRYQFQSAPGICWKTLQGSYSCQINAGLPTNPVRNQPPPTNY